MSCGYGSAATRDPIKAGSTEPSAGITAARLTEEMDRHDGFPPLPKLTVDGLPPGIVGIKSVPK